MTNTPSAEDILGPKNNATQPEPTSIPSPQFEENCGPDFDEPDGPEGSSNTTQPTSDEEAKLFASILDCEWDPRAKIEEPRAVYSLNGKVWATPGNFTAFSAMSKAGKSAVTGGIMASVMPGYGDCFGFHSENPNGHALIQIDTEQSKWHHSKKMMSALSRKGITADTVPTWLKSYHLTGKKISFAWLEAILKLNFDKFGGIHSVILDGGADFVSDLNNQEVSFDVVRGIMTLSEKYKTHFIVVIHINPGSREGKTRGHFGSELDRKAETNLTIKVEKDSRVVYASSARDCYISEQDGTFFSWSDEEMRFVTTSKDCSDGFSVVDIVEAVHSAKSGIKRADLRAAFVEKAGIPLRSYQRKLTEALDQKLINDCGSRKNCLLAITEKGRQMLAPFGSVQPDDAASESSDEPQDGGPEASDDPSAPVAVSCSAGRSKV